MNPTQIRMNDSWEDAIADDVKLLGGVKPAAELMFPNKSPARGEDTIRAWMNPSRAEEPSPGELARLIREAKKEAGYSNVARFFEGELNCRIEFLSPEDEKAQLQREYIRAVEALRSLTDRIDRNEQRLAVVR